MGSCLSKNKEKSHKGFFARRMSHIRKQEGRKTHHGILHLQDDDNVEFPSARKSADYLEPVPLGDQEMGLYVLDTDADKLNEAEARETCEMLKEMQNEEREYVEMFFRPGTEQVTTAHVGRRCIAKHMHPLHPTPDYKCKGTIRYVEEGKHHQRVVGVALDGPCGEHNGACRQYRKFKCRPGHGIYLSQEDIEILPLDLKYASAMSDKCILFPKNVASMVPSGPMIYYTEGDDYSERSWIERHVPFSSPALNLKILAVLAYCPLYDEFMKRGAPEMVELHEKIGDGNFGEVFKGATIGWPMEAVEALKMMGQHPYEENGVWKLKTAFKRLKETATEEETILFAQEAVVSSQLEHPRVILFVLVSGGAKFGGGPLTLHMEYCVDGDLQALLRKGKLTWNDILRALVDIADGMLFLSSTGFVHRDLATRNVFVNNGKAKIGDLGLSRQLDSSFVTQKSENVPVPIRWTSPEAYFYHEWSWHSDVWSYGIVAYECFTAGALPYFGLTNSQVLKDLEDGVHLPPPPNCPPSIYGIMTACWESKPEERPNFGAVLAMLVNVLSGSEPVVIEGNPSTIEEFEKEGNEIVENRQESTPDIMWEEVEVHNPSFRRSRVTTSLHRSKSMRSVTSESSITPSTHMYSVSGHEYYIPDGIAQVRESKIPDELFPIRQNSNRRKFTLELKEESTDRPFRSRTTYV
eukprot:m.3487 g.3487  ORF g.3487 m.3487 type:complete len:693 (+) comp2780_c0_seq1:1033-3111(+)